MRTWGGLDFVIWVTSNCLAPLIVSSGPEDFILADHKTWLLFQNRCFQEATFLLKNYLCVSIVRPTHGDNCKQKNQRRPGEAEEHLSPFFLSFSSFSNLRLLNSHTSPIKITQSWSNSFLLSLTKLEPCLAETLVPLKNLGPMETVEMLLLAGIQAARIWTGARTDDRLFYPCKGMLLPPDKTITIYNYIDMKQIQIPQS